MKYLISSIGTVLLVAGIFLGIVGVINGFGTPTILFRVMWVGIGAASCIMGLYLLYIGSDRDWDKLVKNILDGIFRGI